MKTSMIGPDPTEMEGVLPEGGGGISPYFIQNSDFERGDNISNEISRKFSRKLTFYWNFNY
jgi:hypothetical protein